MIGGATRVVADNIRDFHNDGAFEEIGVFCSLKGGPVPHMMRCYAGQFGPVFSVATQIRPDADFLVSDPAIKERFETVLDYFQPDIVHFHCLQRLTSDVALAALERKIPYFITMHDGWWISDRQFLVNEAGDIETYDYENREQAINLFGEAAARRQDALKLVLDGATGLLTVSETFRDVVRNRARLPSIEAVPNGSSPLEALNKTPSDKVTIGYLAGIAHYKGYHHLRAALMHGTYDRIRLVVVDHSLRENQVVKEVWGATEVERRGLTPQDQIASLYQRFHAVIVPSIWPESYGLVAREALSTRCWLFASNRGAAAEDVAEGRNGHVFDPGDPDDFARLLDMINKNSLRYSAPAQETVIRRTTEQANELKRLYSKAT